MITKAKKQKFGPGDLFFVPLSDGSNVVGQVLEITPGAMNSCVCAFFDVRVGSETQEMFHISEKTLIAVLFVTTESLKMGSWPIVANQAAAVDVEKFLPLRDLASRGFVGAKIRGSQIIDDFLAAFYALAPWDGLHDPNYYEKLLVSQNRRPSKLLLTKS